MNLKILAAITSGILITSAHAALACPFSSINRSASNTSDGAPTLISPTQSDFNKLGIGAGAAAVLAIGILAVRRAGKKAASEPDDFAVSTFAIPVHLEALTPASEDADDVQRVG